MKFSEKAATEALPSMYVSMKTELVLKPANLTFEEAAAVPMAALTALQGLRDKGQIRAGQKVLINGASGGVGTFAVQIAKSFETEVTGVCRTTKMDFVRSMGADHVIDYTREDVTKNKQQYDLIFDTAAYRSISEYKRILSPGGIYVLAGGSMARIFQLMLISMTGSQEYGTHRCENKPKRSVIHHRADQWGQSPAHY